METRKYQNLITTGISTLTGPLLQTNKVYTPPRNFWRKKKFQKKF